MLKMLMSAALSLAVAIGVGTPVAAQERIRFAVTDVEGAEALQREYGAFARALGEVIGTRVELFPVTSRTIGVEAMASSQVDFVLTGPAEYVVFRARTNAEPVVVWTRPNYFPQVVVLANGPIRTVADLRGRTISFGEIGSTSQHLGPAQALADLGLRYNVDYRPTFLNRNVAVEALIRGDIAAVGLNFTHLQAIRRRFPETPFFVVARGRDLPDDVLVARPGLDRALVERVRQAFVQHGARLMTEILRGDDARKYEGGHFLTAIEDANFNYVRSMYRTIGINEFSRFIQ
jgi:phosphonate transport system substrate-binding protein